MRRDSVVVRLWSGRARAGRVVSGLVAAAMALAPLTGCTVGQRQGQSSSYFFIQSLQAASGATPDKLSGTLASDVVTKGTIYADPAEVIVKLALKDPGTSDTPTVPSTTNYITLTRYHVDFVRADGRDQQGIDVPYSFDGGITATVTADSATVDFTLVRIQSKIEAPLAQLVGSGGAITISTIARVTFYGADQAGREVSATGNISVNFADWGDPQ
jgi:hypothetical protein